MRCEVDQIVSLAELVKQDEYLLWEEAKAYKHTHHPEHGRPKR